MNTLNKTLQKQLNKYLGGFEVIPQSLQSLLTAISDTYDHNEKDRKMLERSIELSSVEMKELYNKLRQETEQSSKEVFEKLNESLSILKHENKERNSSITDYSKLAEIAELLKVETLKGKQIEEELIKQKTQLEASQTIARIGSWDFDLSTKKLTWSAEMYRIYNCDEDTFTPNLEAFKKILHPDDIENMSKYLTASYAGVEQDAIEFRILNGDDSIKYLIGDVEIILDEKGKPVKLIGTTQDITERKKIEDKVAQNEFKFRTLINNSSDAVFILAPDGQPLYSSPSIKEVLGYTEEEILRINVFSIMYPENIPYVQQVLGTPPKNPGMPEKGFVGRMRHKDGSWQVCEAVVTNMLHDPMIGGIIINFRNVTERISAEKKIRNANRLYQFISMINQTIVHAENEKVVFSEACRIAVDIGKFRMAWIDIFDSDNKRIEFIKSSGIPIEDMPLFADFSYENSILHQHILDTGSSYVCGDIENEHPLAAMQVYCKAHELHSCMVLPVKKAGKVFGTFNLYASRKNFFDQNEITLLEEVVGDISFALDLFEKDLLREQMSRKIKYSEYRLKQAQAIAHFGSWEIDFFTGLGEWSDETCRIYGVPVDDNEQTYEDWESYIHRDDLNDVRRIMKKSRNSLERIAFYHRIITGSGSVRSVYTQIEYDIDGHGEPVGLHGVVHDITEIKESEKSLAQSEANLRLIMDRLAQAIFVKDINGVFLYANKSFADFHGLITQDIINKSSMEILPVKEESKLFNDEDKFVIISGQSKVVEEQHFKDHKGNDRICRYTKIPYNVIGSQEKAVLCILEDISRQKQTEQEREKIISDIIHRNNDLEQFAYITSHNLRAPVASILGMSNLLIADIVDSSDHMEINLGINEAANKLDDVIKDINNIISINKSIAEKKETIYFSVLIDRIVNDINSKFSIVNFTINTNFDIVDEFYSLYSYFYSIFYNLISNSIKYSRQNAGTVIEVKSRVEENNILIIYKDNGIGIDLVKYEHKIFGLYNRFHDHVEGKGMGLYMVKKQVELLGGNISIRSEVGHGTEFTIAFQN